MAEQVAAAERRDGDRGRDQQRRAEPAAGQTLIACGARLRGVARDGGSSGGGPAATSRSCTRRGAPLLRRQVVAHELVEVGASQLLLSSAPASRASAARVLVLTVPSGMSRNSAISLCERPLQYASSSTVRSRSGSSSSARWTRHATQPASARSGGPLPARARRWASRPAARCGRGRGRRSRCARRRRATGRRARARAGSSGAERQIDANVSCTASSARPRSPSRRSASAEHRAGVAVVELARTRAGRPSRRARSGRRRSGSRRAREPCSPVRAWAASGCAARASYSIPPTLRTRPPLRIEAGGLPSTTRLVPVTNSARGQR